MSNIIKYRVHEVGKDFERTSKEIIETIAPYYPGNKNHMTSLEDAELDIVFEKFTQDNAVESFEK